MAAVEERLHNEMRAALSAAQNKKQINKLTNYLFRRFHSLIARKNSLFNPLGNLAKTARQRMGLGATICTPEGQIRREFPVFSLLNRGIPPETSSHQTAPSTTQSDSADRSKRPSQRVVG